ncbi:MAG: ketopantoate reductase family protein [Clostridia bacterium]
MKILILGAGAMGSLFAGKLKRSGIDVTLFNHRLNDHVRAMQENGLTIMEKDESPVEVTLPVVTDADKLEDSYDLVICLVKSFATEAVLTQIAPVLSPTTMLLTLQNGIGNAEVLETFVPKSQIAVGGTVSGAGIIEPGRVVRRGWGKTSIGSVLGQGGQTESMLRDIASLFTASGLQTEVVPDVMSVIWSKLLVNIAYNGLTAVTRLTNGDMIRTDEGKELARNLIEEAIRIAEALGIRLLYEHPVEEVIRLGYEAIGPNKSSMLTDVLLQRKTEMDAINGAVVRLGKQLSIATPCNEMMMQLVKMIENHYDRMVTRI